MRYKIHIFIICIVGGIVLLSSTNEVNALHPIHGVTTLNELKEGWIQYWRI